ncbi:eukaryotic cytochrome b561-domain-containing protein [Glomus cerebriforme]|uniref:Eukaryotic cytochrome b561-domain-containing protein n=1 Tax=Glomus cerebriforme TaxID=658196 RepID=A0A397SNT8_9GLOM|nr:eukaryotic cytochrome b561-domain-containing protein [Glomus cerebriforme]
MATSLFTRKLIMEDIERNHVRDYSNTQLIIKNFDKNFLFHISANCGLFLYTGTNLYISYIADYKLFTWHPVSMAFMIFFSTQGTVLLQRAVKKHEKARNTLFHKILQLFSLSCLITGFIIIYNNKKIKGKTHYKTYHAKIGLMTFILYIIQTIGGLILIYFPSLFGGISKSKKYYKHHRLMGYIILFLIWLSAITSTQSKWIMKYFNQYWIWVVSIGMIFVGVIARINLNKIKIGSIKWNFAFLHSLIQYRVFQSDADR